MISPPPDFRDHILVLAGAGLSNYMGLRSLDTLPQYSDEAQEKEVQDVLRDTYDLVQGRRWNTAAFEEVVAQLRQYLELAETLRTDHVFQKQLQLPPEVRTGLFSHKWRRALTRCYRILLSEYGPKKLREAMSAGRHDEYQSVVHLLQRIAEQNGGHLVVYTTNYDCSFQVLAKECQELQFSTHIHNENGSFREMWYPSPPPRPHTTPHIYVNRLHGCVGWFDEPQSPYRVGEVFGAGDDMEILDDAKINQMAIKLVTSHEIGNQPAFRHAFDEFEQHLRTATVLLVWGYRFRDKEVVRKIVEASNDRRGSIPCVYINPFMAPGTVVDQIRDTLIDVPVQTHGEFVPIQVEWRPGDGHESLVIRTMDCLTTKKWEQP